MLEFSSAFLWATGLEAAKDCKMENTKAQVLDVVTAVEKEIRMEKRSVLRLVMLLAMMWGTERVSLWGQM